MPLFGPSSLPFRLLESNLLYIDVAGNDGTGARGNPAKPFATGRAAQTAAMAGDTIIVRPGTYTNLVGFTNLGKDQVNWCLLNAIIAPACDGTGIFAVFNDLSGDMNMALQGHGQIQCVDTSGNGHNIYGFLINNGDNIVSVENSISVFVDDGGNGHAYGVYSYGTFTGNVTVGNSGTGVYNYGTFFGNGTAGDNGTGINNDNHSIGNGTAGNGGYGIYNEVGSVSTGNGTAGGSGYGIYNDSSSVSIGNGTAGDGGYGIYNNGTASTGNGTAGGGGTGIYNTGGGGTSTGTGTAQGAGTGIFNDGGNSSIGNGVTGDGGYGINNNGSSTGNGTAGANGTGIWNGDTSTGDGSAGDSGTGIYNNSGTSTGNGTAFGAGVGISNSGSGTSKGNGSAGTGGVGILNYPSATAIITGRTSGDSPVNNVGIVILQGAVLVTTSGSIACINGGTTITYQAVANKAPTGITEIGPGTIQVNANVQ